MRCVLMECDRRGVEGVRFNNRLPSSAALAVRHFRHGCFADNPVLLALEQGNLQAMLAVLHQVATTWHLHRRLAAAGKAFKEMLPALRCPCSMRPRAMLYRVCVVPALPCALPKTSGLKGKQVQPLTSAHNAFLRHVTGMGRKPDGALYNGSDARGGGSVPIHAHPQYGKAQAPRSCGQDA
mmetsp:Transcript_28668/g.84830  ORF Transcript_28668/g.84830 Transcript_28668/m.84830 type:complete len:181 (-) Transcript_28668:245-787(-)